MQDIIEISTIKDIIDKVPEKDFESFLIDFIDYIRYRKNIEPLVKIGLIQVNYSMNWINDGKNETKIKFDLITKQKHKGIKKL